jgi:hypothetical protein
MTFYESNQDVRPTGAEIEEYVDQPLPDPTRDAPTEVVSSRQRTPEETRPAAGDGGKPYLRIYLNDHRAGSAAGLALARRSQRNNAGSALGATLGTIVEQFVEDAAALQRIAQHLDVPENRVKTAAARAAEFVGRAKSNGHVFEYSDLSRLLELEALLAAIDAKKSLWRALIATRVAVPAETDLAELERRAVHQRELLRPFHLTAAHEALHAATSA